VDLLAPPISNQSSSVIVHHSASTSATIPRPSEAILGVVFGSFYFYHWVGHFDPTDLLNMDDQVPPNNNKAD
jgi:hypothetical protein